MSYVNNEQAMNNIKQAKMSFQELMQLSNSKTKEVNFKPEIGVWYKGTLDSIVLTKTLSKSYPSIKITFAILNENDKNKPHKIIMNHILSNAAGVKSIRDIKVLLSSLGVSNKDINSINNIETEYKFAEYLQQFVGINVRIMSLSDTSYKKYKIEKLEEASNNGQ